MELTERQSDINRTVGGLAPKRYVTEILNLLEAGAFSEDDPDTVRILEKLKEKIEQWLGRFQSA